MLSPSSTTQSILIISKCFPIFRAAQKLNRRKPVAYKTELSLIGFDF